MMFPHLRYLWYVLRHKWYVLRAGLVLDVPLRQLIAHDASKFSRAEWGPYVRRFYGGRGGVMDKAADPESFQDAWRHHWQSNPHHPEYWQDRPDEQADPANYTPMPAVYAREMVADWYGAGMAQGKSDCWGYYLANRERYPFHPDTREMAEACLFALEHHGLIPARGMR